MDTRKTGELIAQARKEKELTQKELAEKLHVSTQAVSKWENGRSCPDIALLEPLAEALDLTVTELLSGRRGEEPKEEVVRDSLRFGLSQLGPKIRRWKWLFLCAAALLLALALALWTGYIWVRDSTELLPQRETVVRPVDVTNREATLAHAAGKTMGYLYQVDFADDVTHCSFRWELWTHEGLEKSWDTGEQLRRDDMRHKLVGVTLVNAWNSPVVEYGIALESPRGTAVLGLKGALNIPYMGSGMGFSVLDRRTDVDREEGAVLLVLTLSKDDIFYVDDSGEWGDFSYLLDHEQMARLLLRMYCE